MLTEASLSELVCLISLWAWWPSPLPVAGKLTHNGLTVSDSGFGRQLGEATFPNHATKAAPDGLRIPFFVLTICLF